MGRLSPPSNKVAAQEDKGGQAPNPRSRAPRERETCLGIKTSDFLFGVGGGAHLCLPVLPFWVPSSTSLVHAVAPPWPCFSSSLYQPPRLESLASRRAVISLCTHSCFILTLLLLHHHSFQPGCLFTGACFPLPLLHLYDSYGHRGAPRAVSIHRNVDGKLGAGRDALAHAELENREREKREWTTSEKVSGWVGWKTGKTGCQSTHTQSTRHAPCGRACTSCQ